jgi:hypothetical protein
MNATTTPFIFEREETELLIVPQKTEADHWLAGWKAGYRDRKAKPPRGVVNAKNYLDGFTAGTETRIRLNPLR